jgi:hypothetical protein
VYAHPESNVDIVLVHGLNGHPRNTWTAKNGVFWPNQLLPVTLKNAKARVLVYGYNADVYAFGNDRSASTDMIHQHAQTMISSLAMERMSEEKEENAIIWVVHSLGGILVKRVSATLAFDTSVADIQTPIEEFLLTAPYRHWNSRMTSQAKALIPCDPSMSRHSESFSSERRILALIQQNGD